MKVLDYSVWEAGLREDVGNVFGGGWCLRRWLKDYRVAGKEGWDEGVDQGEVRVLLHKS